MSLRTDPSPPTVPAVSPDVPSSSEASSREDRVFARILTFASLATVVLVMARVTKHAADPLDNTDMWFHLKLGHEFLGGWSLRDPGQLSSFATSPWVPTQWSVELLMAKVEDWFGLPGIAWLFGALYLMLIVAVFLLCRAHGDLLPAAVGTGVCVIAAGASLSARPQVVSLILFVLTVAAWNRAARTLRPPWWLVPLTWLWATAHGLWTAGIIVGVVTAIGVGIDQRFGLRRTLRLLLVPLASVLAACLTPVGPALLTSQLAVGARTSMITEWGPTSFRGPEPLLVALMVGVVVLRWSRRGSVPWTALLQLGVAVGWVLLVVRMVPFGAILAAPLFVAAVTEVIPQRTRSGVAGRAEKAVVVGAALLCLVGLTVAAPQTADRPAGVPTAFEGRLAVLPAGTPVIVEDGSGAWMESEFPGVQPIIDGMLDAYPVSYIATFSDLITVQQGWTRTVAQSRARVGVVLGRSALAAALQEQLGWRVVQRDRDWVYLEAPDAR